jgi:predicted RNA methylase
LDDGDEGQLPFIPFVLYSRGCVCDGRAGVDEAALVRQQEQLAATRALDLGCGNGLFCCMLASGGVGQVVGIDYADSAVELAHGVRGRVIAGCDVCRVPRDAASR